MTAISNFLDWWQAELAVTDRDPSNDPAKNLYYAYMQAVADLQDARAQTLDFIEPVKNSKGVWLCGFAPDRVEEVAALAGEIARKQENLKSICHGIEAFLRLTADEPDVRAIITERARAQGAINHASRSAEAARQKAFLGKKSATITELASCPAIIEAEANLTTIRQANEPIIAALTAKISEINGILDKYPQG